MPIDPAAIGTTLQPVEMTVDAARLRFFAKPIGETEPEPLPAGHPLWSAPELILAPHISGLTEGVWQRSWNIARHQLGLYARGERPTNVSPDPTSVSRRRENRVRSP